MSLLGPDGLPVTSRKVRVVDGQLEYQDAAGVRRIDPNQTLINAARMQRDGASIEAIMNSLDLVGEARNPFIVQRALVKGHQLLDEAIARGDEPEETHAAPPAERYDPREDDD